MLLLDTRYDYLRIIIVTWWSWKKESRLVNTKHYLRYCLNFIGDAWMDCIDPKNGREKRMWLANRTWLGKQLLVRWWCTMVIRWLGRSRLIRTNPSPEIFFIPTAFITHHNLVCIHDGIRERRKRREQHSTARKGMTQHSHLYFYNLSF